MHCISSLLTKSKFNHHRHHPCDRILGKPLDHQLDRYNSPLFNYLQPHPTNSTLYSWSPTPYPLVRHRIPNRDHDDLSTRSPRFHKPLRSRSSRQHTATDLRPNQLTLPQRGCLLGGNEQQDLQVSQYLRRLHDTVGAGFDQCGAFGRDGWEV